MTLPHGEALIKLEQQTLICPVYLQLMGGLGGGEDRETQSILQTLIQLQKKTRGKSRAGYKGKLYI